MRLHILGIGGTFMAGIALLAKQKGHEVAGSDVNLYPPMSTQLIAHGIQVREGYDPLHIDPQIDCVIIGNVIKRGNKAVEYVLANDIPYQSGPAWLFENVLKKLSVLGVAGTHGKTTTSSLLAWILESAGLQPGFLIGGIPENFGCSARLGNSAYFVIEADEYDSAFFDKRSKFIHYHPKIMILNNLEYDHADIFPHLNAVKQQFHDVVKTIPENGRIIYNGQDENLAQVLSMGCWSQLSTFAQENSDWQAILREKDGSIFTVLHQGKEVGQVKWSLVGNHNVANALAALAAAYHINVSPQIAIPALTTFRNVKRRLEIKGKVNNIMIYDDFAHHPTAIATTLAGLRAKIGPLARLIAVLEFGSYTMRAGIHKDKIGESLIAADKVICKNTEHDWGLKTVLASRQNGAVYDDVDTLVAELAPTLCPGDHVVIMSNSSFGGIHQKLMAALTKRGEQDESQAS